MRLSLYEAAAFGVNMTVPYGAWMGSTIEDAFYAPHELATEVQTFLAEHEELYTRATDNEVAVIYSIESNRDLIGRQDASDLVINARDESIQVPYRLVTQSLATAPVAFDVVLFADGMTADDRAELETLSGYDTVIAPACTYLTTLQASVLQAYLDAGGCLVVVGELGLNLSEDLRQALLSHPGTRTADMTDVDALQPRGRQVEIAGNVGVNVQRLEDGSAALHLVNYDYDHGTDSVRQQRDVEVRVRLAATRSTATAYSSTGDVVALDVRGEDGLHSFRLPRLGLYSIVVLGDGGDPRTAANGQEA